ITLAGTGTGGCSGDGGPAAGAQLYSPSGLAVDSAGNLYIADTNNYRVRYVQIAPVSPPELATLTLSGSPALYYTGAPLTFNLGELTLAGADQYGAVFDLSGQTVTWAVYSGPATVSGSVLIITGSGTVSVAASVYGVTSNILDLSVGTGSSELATLTLSGSPALNYSGVPLTYDLNGLTLVGADQSGAAFDLSGQTVTWAVYSGPATVSGSLLTITGSDTVSVTASVYGITSNILSLTVASPPAVTADTTDNIAGQDMELTFTDDPAWRDAISEISVDGAALNSGAYLKSAGKITIKSYVFTTSKDYDIVIKAAGYGDARVTQRLFALAITGDGVATPVTLTLGQLQEMQQYRHIYSVINTWPTKNWYVGEGVKLKDLFVQAGIKEDAKLINVIASDGYRMTFTVQELLKDQRYYFPYFMNKGYSGEIPGSPADAEEVETILALKSARSNNFGDITDSDALHLIIGQRAVTEQMNDKYVKHVSKIEVLTTAPEKWDNPQASPGSGVVPAGTMVALSNAHMDNDKIYFTTDGSTPTVNSLMYNWIARRWWGSRADDLAVINHPIKIQNNTIIKAVTIGPGKLDSDVVTFEYQVSGDTLAPPALAADTIGNTVGQAVDLTFAEDAAWRAAITGVAINGNALTTGQYAIAAGVISIDASVFSVTGDYTIAVTAVGYSDATVTQHIDEQGTNAVYALTPTDDTTYQTGATLEGIKTMTVNSGVSGMKYFNVHIAPVSAHDGLEAVVFTHLRNGVQLSINVTKAD
ncbi:MAG TPA: hypothetical protein DCZ10_15675, partial [Pelotomaculum sp.]|nr:hypothetical protein [Pelotomaculum sp.]